jgi:hypothetical protein
MSDTPTSGPFEGAHPFPPPPPPPERGRGGCGTAALIGCGAVLVLVVLLVAGGVLWFQRNEGTMADSVREGARFGLEADEEACVAEGTRRSGEVGSFAAGVATGTWVRGCLEHARESAGFCVGVPSLGSLRQTAAWQGERCGDDAACRNAYTVVQQYCADGQPKRTAADTLAWHAGPPDGGAPPPE